MDSGNEVRLLNLEQVAEMLGCSTQHVKRLNASQEMPAPVRLGRRRLWDKVKLTAWLDAMAADDAVIVVSDVVRAIRANDTDSADRLLSKLRDGHGIDLRRGTELAA